MFYKSVVKRHCFYLQVHYLSKVWFGLVLKKHFSLISMLETVVLLSISVDKCIIFINVFTLTFDQFNASLLNF